MTQSPIKVQDIICDSNYRYSTCETASDDNVFNKYTDRDYDEYSNAPRVLLRHSTLKHRATRFFGRFFDKLRDDYFSLDFPVEEVSEDMEDSDAGNQGMKRIPLYTHCQLSGNGNKVTPKKLSNNICTTQHGSREKRNSSRSSSTNLTPPKWV